MPAFATKSSRAGYKPTSKSSSDSSKSSSDSSKGKDTKKKGNNKKKNSKKKTDWRLENFQKYLEKLFDWIEVRLDRVQRKIDNATKKAELATGYQNKNANIDTAISQTKNKIADSKAGAKRYQKQANSVLAQAQVKKNKKGKKSKKGKALISSKQAKDIKNKVANGTIDIKSYPKKIQEVIKAYQGWYEKSLDCQDAQLDLEQSLNELQQQKLDNITDQYDTIIDKINGVIEKSKTLIEIMQTFNKGVDENSANAINADTRIDYTYANGIYNNGGKEAIIAQYRSQKEQQIQIANERHKEAVAYEKEMTDAADQYGADSNEYRQAEAKLQEVRNQELAARLEALNAQKEIDQIEVSHFEELKKEYESIASRTQAEQGLTETRISNLRAKGERGTRLGDATYSNEIRSQLSIKKNQQAILSATYQKEYNEALAQYEKVKNAKGAESLDARQAYVDLQNIQKSLEESLNSELEIAEDIKETYINEFEKAIAAYDRDASLIVAAISKNTAEAELLKAKGRHEYSSGMGEATYTDEIINELLAKMVGDQENLEIARKKLNNAEEDFKDIQAQYSSDDTRYQDEYEKLLKIRAEAVDAERQTIEDQMEIDNMEKSRINAIKEKYESYISLANAVTEASKFTVEYLKTRGDIGNSLGIRNEMNGQLTRQEQITDLRQKQYDEVMTRMSYAAAIFGKDSNDYRELQVTAEGIRKDLIESRSAQIELQRQLDDLNYTVRNQLIDNIKKLVDKLASLTSLAEKRGTNRKYGYEVTEKLYTDQIAYNGILANMYNEQRSDRVAQLQKEMETGQVEIGSDRYKELYEAIMESEEAVISLLSSNEDLKASIRTLRWKPYNDLLEKLDQINSDFEHISKFIRDEEILDEYGQFTDRGFAKIAMVGEQMDLAEKKIANARVAMQKLNEEVENGTINEEQFNSELKSQLDIIQSASESLFDYQTKLADLYIQQITKENDLLQELIDKRSEALSKKKQYYDYDKQIKSKNKDIATIQAQIAALQGTTADSAKAKRAKLEAELKEKQEDLEDTRYDHLIEVQEEVYSKLSEDMNKILDEVTKAINGNHEELMKVSNAMLAQLELNDTDEGKIINDIIQGAGTSVSTATADIINELSGSSEGISNLLDSLGIDVGGIETNTVGITTGLSSVEDVISNRIPDGCIANLDSNVNIANATLLGIESAIKTDLTDAINKWAETGEKEKRRQEENQKAAEEVISKINEIGNVVYSSESKNKIDVARQAYNKLTEEQRNLVGKTNLDTLTNAETNYASLKNEDDKKKAEEAMQLEKDKAAASAVIEKIKAIGNVALTTESANKINFAQAEFDKLNKRAQSFVSNKDVLSQAHTTYKKLDDDEKERKRQAELTRQQNEATKVVNKIKAIGTVTLNSANAINDAQNAYNALTEYAKNFVSNYGTLTSAHSTYKKLYDAYTVKKNEADKIRTRITELDNLIKSCYNSAMKAATNYKKALQAYDKANFNRINATSGKNAQKYEQEAQKQRTEAIKWQNETAKYGKQQKGYEIEKDKLQKQLQTTYKGYKSGSKRINQSQLAWTNENWEDGSELIIRPSDGAILTPLKTNDAVIPTNFAENLFKWGAINPDSFAVNPFMGKWGESAGGNSSEVFSNNTTNQNVEMHFDSLIRIEGNVDENVVSRLEDLSKSLTNNKDFQKNVIKFVTKDFVKESKKLGLR